MLDKELKIIIDNPTNVVSIEQALSVLEDHRVIYFLRAFGRCTSTTKSTYEQLAIEGAHNAGWNDAFDALVNFKEIFIEKYKKLTNLPKADYGGKRSLLEKGDITQQEFDDLGKSDPKHSR